DDLPERGLERFGQLGVRLRIDRYLTCVKSDRAGMRAARKKARQNDNEAGKRRKSAHGMQSGSQKVRPPSLPNRGANVYHLRPRPLRPRARRATMSHDTGKEALTYRAAGVDIDAGEEVVERIKPLVARTFRKEVMAGLGGFGALFELAG